MNRINKKFKELGKKKALIIYITAGYPSLAKTKEMIFEIEEAGADIIELGIPFSDPLADGPTIQLASERALKNGVSLKDVISLVRKVRNHTQIPLVFMTYYNPVFHYGIERFVKAASAAGVDGVIVPDLPPEEAKLLMKYSKKAGLADIFLLTPTSSDKRIKSISKASSGFIYYVSLTGVTGARKKLPKEIKNNIKRIKRFTKKPVCIGFGVSDAIQANQMSKIADGVIVGSAVINIIHKKKRIAGFIRGLKNAIK